ncbi:MAG: MBL fold metallo-hydrolase [Caulobacteraceae bacterium]|nr:MBL fold metallo-hydrolase [Caulobacteraceae bacterium]
MSKTSRFSGKRLTLAVLAMSSVAALGVVLAAVFAPYVSAELNPWLEPHQIVDPAPARIAKGRMVGDYFAVEDVGGGVFAIGEPRYYQRNYAYLIIGQERALLFDSGSGTRDISGVVAGLTRLPVTVMASHLHYDHLGGIAPFAHVAMIDLPQTRADVSRGLFRAGRYEYLGLIDHLAPPPVKVGEWLAPGAVIDLGGRSLTVLNTPGHTPTSAALWDAAGHRLFIGDYIYPTTLYAFLPGASLSAYHHTARRLLTTLPADTVLWTAHCCRKGEGVAAPWLSMRDLRDLDAALTRVARGQARPTGFYPRIYPVNRQMTLATGFGWNNR